jgi:hypothetical protein
MRQQLYKSFLILNKFLKVFSIPIRQYSKYRKHDAHIQPNPSLEPLLIHAQHLQEQLKLTKEQIHEDSNEDKGYLESFGLNITYITYYDSFRSIIAAVAR